MDNSIYKKRQENLARTMKKKNINKALFENAKHIFYLTGFSILFSGVKNDLKLILEVEKEEVQATLVVSEGLADSASKYADNVIEVKHSFTKGSATRNEMFAGFLSAEMHNTEALLTAEIENMRKFKDSREKDLLRSTGRLSQIAYRAIAEECVSGKSELDLLLCAQNACINANGKQLFVSGDFVSGERTIDIGGEATQRKLSEGENVIVDLWLISNLYWSDTCRTFFVDGNASPEKIKVIEMLQEISEKSEKSIKPGVKAVDIYNQIQNSLGKYGYRCPHHLGHGIGIDFWEAPFITEDSEDVFEENMAFTIEIGVYDKDLQGFRLENNYILNESGLELISC